jgi:hypothetical protein
MRIDRSSLALGFVKLSILIMYRRVFDIRGVRIAVNILGIMTVIWMVLFIALNIFQCTPIHRAWENSRVPGTCLNIKALFMANAIPNIVTDFTMLALPIWPVSRLRLPLSQRIAVGCIFMLGGVVCVASLYRVTTVTDLDQNNIAFTIRGAAIFGHVEAAVAVVSACLPTLRPLFMQFMHAVGLGDDTRKDGENPPKVLTRPSTAGTTRGTVSHHVRNSSVTSSKGSVNSNKALPRLPTIGRASTIAEEELGIIYVAHEGSSENRT